MCTPFGWVESYGMCARLDGWRATASMLIFVGQGVAGDGRLLLGWRWPPAATAWRAAVERASQRASVDEPAHDATSELT
jgi:hypothetical protein